MSRSAEAPTTPIRGKKGPRGSAPPRARRGPTRVSTPHREDAGAAEVGLRKAPRQRRSQRVVDDILEAAALTFSELGYAKATTNRIAERAGVSVGSLYQYFPSKDGLLARLLREHHAQVHALTDSAIARLADPKVPLEDILRTLLVQLVEVHVRRPAMARALSEVVLRQSAALEHVWPNEQEHREVECLQAALAARPDVRKGDRRVMAAILERTIGQLIRWVVHDAPPELDRATLVDEIVELLVRYLRR